VNILPAIDLRDGKCVQLRGGSYDRELIRLPDPISVASSWFDAGYEKIHIVDLDSATNNGNNTSLIIEMLQKFPNTIQVGGGIRQSEDIKILLDNGAVGVMVGTKAIIDNNWRNEMVNQFPNKIIVAADVDKDQQVLISGWTEKSGKNLVETLKELEELELGGVLITSIEEEGKMEGVNIDIFKTAIENSSKRIIAAGGISNMRDVQKLEDIGITDCVIGTAMYLGDFKNSNISQNDEVSK
jgi:phosphoribosylformimino-5-aminoimidazole carboxamide ribotide isomerase